MAYVIIAAMIALIIWSLYGLAMTNDTMYLWVRKNIFRETIISAYDGEYEFNKPFRTVYRGLNDTYWCDKYRIGKISFLSQTELEHCGKYSFKIEN